MTAEDVLRALVAAEAAYRATLQDVQARGADLFKAVRRERHLTQREFAAILGVDFSFISKVENGRMRPGKPVLERLTRYLAEPPAPEGGSGTNQAETGT